MQLPEDATVVQLPDGMDVSTVIQLTEEQALQLQGLLAAGYSPEEALAGLGINLDGGTAAAVAQGIQAYGDAGGVGRPMGSSASDDGVSLLDMPVAAPSKRGAFFSRHASASGGAGAGGRTLLEAMMDAGPAAPRCLLRVWGLQARNLRTADSNGLSDPYLILRCGAERWTSRVISGTLNPIWGNVGDQAVFGTGGSDKTLGIGRAALPASTSAVRLRPQDFEREDVLYIDLMDKDTFGADEQLGSATVYFGDLFAVRPPEPGPSGVPVPWVKAQDLWLPVYYQGAPCGEVFVSLEAIGYRPPPSGASLTLEDAPLSAMAGSEAAAAGAGAAAVAGGAFYGDRSLAPVPGTLPPNCLKLLVRGCTLRKPANAYFQLTVGSYSVRSTIAPSTSAPAWGQGWAFPVVDRATAITLDVQESGTFSKSLLGRFAGHLGNFDGRAGVVLTQTCPLTDRDGKVVKAGREVSFQLLWCYNPAFDPAAPSNAVATAAASAAGSLFGGGGGKSGPRLEPVALDASGNMPGKIVTMVAVAGKALTDVTVKADGSWGEVEMPQGGAAGGAAAAAGGAGAGAGAGTAATESAAAAAARARVEALSRVEIKDGDWQVQVHVIEARKLKPENLDGTSDPVVHVEVGGKKAHTAIHKGCTSCVFDETFFFSFPKFTRAEVEGLSVKVAAYDANLLLRDSMIGLFTFDALEVYYQPGHAYTKRWVGIVDPTNAKDRGLQGYLRLSVLVLGPGDKISVPGALGPAGAAEAGDGAGAAGAKEGGGKEGDKEGGKKGLLSMFGGKKAAAMEVELKAGGEGADLDDADDETSAAALVLLPPSISRKIRWLVVSLHSAEGLPAMDEAAFGGWVQPGIDAFLEVSFAGNPPARTQWITRKGAGNLSVEWNRELWVPFLTPALSSRVELAVYDYDRLKENDRVGTVVLSTRDLEVAPLPLAWWPIYGAPNTVAFGRYKNRMNKLPSLASNYRGRLLLSARIEDDADNEGQGEEVHWRPTVRPPQELMPPMQVFRLRCLVVAGDELPSFTGNAFTAVAAALGATTANVGVMISLAGKHIWTPRVTVVKGQARWNALIECDVVLPVAAGGAKHGDPSPAPLPDTFVYLYTGEPWNPDTCKRVSFARLDTAALLSCGLAGSSAFWQPLKEDMAVNALGDDESAGSILLRVGLGSIGESLREGSWMGELEALRLTRPYELRVHVYQGRNLPAADDNGSIDPYLKVSIAGETRTTTRRYVTGSPAWYETLSFDNLSLPKLGYAPQVHVELWDHDEFSADDFVSELRYSLAHPVDTLICTARSLPPVLPNPKWHRLTRFDTRASNSGDDVAQAHGEVLLGFQLIVKADRDERVPIIPTSIVPPARDMWLEVLALGCRNLAPYAFLPITFPSVEMEVTDVRAAVARSSRRAKPPADTQLRTVKSRYPSGANPNFCERLLVPIKVPFNPLFAPSISLSVIDNRLGGFAAVVVGTTGITLAPKIPWSEGYVPPRGIGKPSSANPFETTEAAPAADRRDSVRSTGSAGAGAGARRSSGMSVVSAAGTARGRDSIYTIAAGPGAGAVNYNTAEEGGRASFSSYGGGGGSSRSLVARGGGGAVALKALSAGGLGPVLEGEEAADGAEAAEGGHVAVAVGGPAGASDPLSSRSFAGLRQSALSGAGEGPGELDKAPPAHATVAVAAGSGSPGSGVYSDAGVQVPAGMLPQGLGGADPASGRSSISSGGLGSAASSSPASPAPGSTGAAKGGAGAGAGLDSARAASAAAGVGAKAPKPGLLQGMLDSVFAGGARKKGGARQLAPDGVPLDIALGGAGAGAGAGAGTGLELVPAAGSALASMHPHDQSLLREYGLDVTRGLLTADASQGVWEEAQIAYLKDRKEYASGLEDVLQGTPFESYSVTRGQRVGALLGDSTRSVGVFKGVIRLLADKDEPAPPGMAAILNPATYVVRVYVLTGDRLQPKDSNGKSDPYVVLKLGDTVINRRAAYVPESTSPGFYQAFEVKTTLPGPSLLTLEVWDYDFISSDDLIGTTTIDLEDRWFEPAWQALGAETETPKRLRTKPIERRDLWVPTSTSSQGAIRLWVDILTPAQALAYPAIDITPPPPRPYEVRAVVWKARGMAAGDYVGDMNDLYFKAWVEGSAPQSTDVHYRAKKGGGSFNWRMVWPVTLPREFFYFKVQAWDKDLLKYNDCLGEGELDLTPHIRRAFKAPAKGLHVFRSDADILKEREAARKRQAEKDAARLASAAKGIEAEDAKRSKKLEKQLIAAGLATRESAPAMAAAAMEKRRAKAAKLLPVPEAGGEGGEEGEAKLEEGSSHGGEGAAPPSVDAAAAAAVAGAVVGDPTSPSAPSAAAGADPAAGPADGSGSPPPRLPSGSLRTRSRYAGAAPGFASRQAEASARILRGEATPSATGSGKSGSHPGVSSPLYDVEEAGADVADEEVDGLDDEELEAATGMPAAEARARLASQRSARKAGGTSGEVHSLADMAGGVARAGMAAATSGISRLAGLVTGTAAAPPTAGQKKAVAAGAMAREDATADAAGVAARGPGESGAGAAGAGAGAGGGAALSERMLASYTGVPLGSLVGLRNATEAGDARATVKALKKAAGLEVDVHPEHAQWVQLSKTEYASGDMKQKVVGEVLVSIELLPEALARKYPAGLGRGAPNQYPTLPPPAGRIKCSINPCYLCAELCGPRLCTTLACCLCCAVVLVVIAIGAPFIHTITLWISLLPKEAAIPIGVLVGLLMCLPPVYCYARFVLCPRKPDLEEAMLGESAADLERPEGGIPDGEMGAGEPGGGGDGSANNNGGEDADPSGGEGEKTSLLSKGKGKGGKAAQPAPAAGAAPEPEGLAIPTSGAGVLAAAMGGGFGGMAGALLR